MKQRVTILFLLIFFIGFSQMQAQRPPCMPDWTSLSYEGKIPDRFPLLKLDMPYETMLFYIWMRDWVYNYNEYEIEHYFNKKSFDDDYKELIKRIYITQDYNPVLLEEQSNYEDTLKKAYQKSLLYMTIERLRYIAPDSITQWSLVKSYIIARIKISDIIKRTMELGESATLTSEIQDIIKGNFIPTCKDLSIPDTPDDYIRPDPYFQINEPGKCFQFIVGRNYTEVNLEVGNDYIIFAHFLSLCTDTLNDCYYTVYLLKQSPLSLPIIPRYFIFPIKNDIVEDPNQLFNFGDSLTYNEWRQKLQEKIDEILNKNYTSVDDDFLNINDVLSIYPNPADDFLYIKQKDFVDFTISLKNLLGQQLINRKFHNANEINRIDISEIPSGMYFVVIESSGKRKAYPIIIR